MIATILRGPIELNTESLIRTWAAPNWVPAWTIGLVGSVLQLYGFLGLYRYLTYHADNRIAFLATLLSATAIALFIWSALFMAVNAPVIGQLYQQGNEEVLAVYTARFTSPVGLAVFGVTGAGYILGPILFAVAIWRDGRLPRWTGVFIALSIAGLLAIPLTFPTELLGAMLLTISSSVIAWQGWQEGMTAAAEYAASRAKYTSGV
jgi:hypothetical protein